MNAQAVEEMSAKQLLKSHLDDYVVILDHLVAGFSRAQTKRVDFEDIINRLVEKDRYIQCEVEKLIAHQAFQARITEVQKEINQLDGTIVGFGARLAQLEQRLHEGVNDERTLKNLDGAITKQPFGIDEVCIFAEKLACMSFAPADYLERKGMNTMRYQRPHPDEEAIRASSLRHSIDDLLEFARQNKEAVKKETEDSKAATAAAIGEVPRSLSFGGDVKFDADAPINTLVPPEGWQPTKLRGPVVARQESEPGPALELDLNPDLSSDEDDFEDIHDDDFDSD